MLQLLISISTFSPLLFEYYAFRDNSSVSLFFIYTLLMFVLLSAMGRWYLLVAAPFILFSAIVGPYVFLTHSHLSYNAISSVIESNLHESLEFMASGFFARFVLLSTIIIILPFVIGNLPGFRGWHLRGKSTFVLLVLPLILLAGFTHANSTNARQVAYRDGLYPYFPLRQVVLIKRYYIETRLAISGYLNQDTDLDVSRDKKNDTSIVLVIGEAARKSSMGVYGSKHETTPYLDQLKNHSPQQIVIFDNALSVAPFTRVAVPSLLSMASAEKFGTVAHTPSIYKLINQTNTDTIYISKAPQGGFHDALIQTMTADNKVVLNSNAEYDGELLDELFEATNVQEHRSKLITIQLSGSHYEYKKRYPSIYDCFVPDIPAAHYLSSIRYTDFVLSRIVEHIDLVKNPYLIVYVSDHGEYVNDDGDGIYGHGYKLLTKNEVEIPFVLIFNKAFVGTNRGLIQTLKSRRNSKISLDHASHTLIGLLGISEDEYYEETYDLSAESFSEQPRFVIDREMRLASIDSFIFSKILSSRPESELIIQSPACGEQSAMMNTLTIAH